MKNTFVSIAALAGLAAAQRFDVAAVNNAPLPAVTVAPVGQAGQSTVAYNPAAASTSINSNIEPTYAPSSSNKMKRGDCSPQGSGSWPQISYPDTAENFQKSPLFRFIANSQTAPFPYIEKFRDLNGSTQQNSYLTFYVLDKYSVAKCASYCDKQSLCTAFNIYAERSPSLDPGAACPNPSSITVYKCALWGSSVSRASATNTGQFREKFRVVIAASNGYDKIDFTPAAIVDGFKSALKLKAKVISLAARNFLGSEFFAGPYDPALCGFYATAQTSANRIDAQNRGVKTYQAANMFNSYTVYKGGFAWGTYCSLYNQNFDASYATDGGVTDGDVSYTAESSWTYTLDPQDPGTL